MQEEIIEKFSEIIDNELGIIKLNNKKSVSVKTFSNLFSDSKELTYDELIRVDKENKYGYKKYIEEWKEKGLVE